MVNTETRRRIAADPAVMQVIRLFDGALAEIRPDAPSTPSPAGDPPPTDRPGGEAETLGDALDDQDDDNDD